MTVIITVSGLMFNRVCDQSHCLVIRTYWITMWNPCFDGQLIPQSVLTHKILPLSVLWVICWTAVGQNPYITTTATYFKIIMAILILKNSRVWVFNYFEPLYFLKYHTSIRLVNQTQAPKWDCGSLSEGLGSLSPASYLGGKYIDIVIYCNKSNTQV